MSTAFQEIASFKGAKDFHRMLRRRIYLPRVAADAVVRTLKYSRNPVQGSVRRRVAKIGPSQEQNDIPERDGYLFIEPDRFPLARVALDAARARFDDLSAAGAVEAARSNANKEFLLSIVHEGEFLDVPEIMSFMISRPVVDMATGYFGAVPVLSSARLWWTPPNATEQQSQLFHRDAEDY